VQPEIDQLGVELAKLDRDDLERVIRGLLSQGVALSFHGKRTALEIYRRVRPRVTRREPRLHVGPAVDQAKNLLVEGENLQAMVTLHKYRGEVDLILTDPPYNTGQYFRYNDRWDNDPNDPELGTLVGREDGSRHTKWIKAMMPRLQVMKAMLKPSGVIAICIDDNELFHLGMMMDEVFGEDNRLGIINWQKAYSPKNDAKAVSKTTEYVLVYAKDRARATTGRVGLDRGVVRNLDNDPDGDWIPSDPTARQYARTLTWRRLANAITGERPNGRQVEPLGGGFEYRLLTKTIDARTVLSMQRSELIDIVLTSHWESQRRSAPSLSFFDGPGYQYLIGTDDSGEGCSAHHHGKGAAQPSKCSLNVPLKRCFREAAQIPLHTSHSRINASTGANSAPNRCRHPLPLAFPLARFFPSAVRGPVECVHALRAFIIRE